MHCPTCLAPSFCGALHFSPTDSASTHARVTEQRFQDSQVNDDIACWLGTADEKIAIGGFVEWLRVVGDCAGDQTALTVVTNAGATSPTDRDITGFGHFQDALVSRFVPVGGNAAARERYAQARARVIAWRMRSSRRCSDYARSPRLAATEDFDVNAVWRNAKGCERLFHVRHELGWAA